AHLLGVRMVDLVEDRQCPLPAVLGGVRLAGGGVGVAEVDQRVRRPVPDTQFQVQIHALAETSGRLLVLTQAMVGVAEAVPVRGRTTPVADRPIDGERLPAVRDGLAVVTEFGVAPAKAVEGARLTDLVTGGAEHVARPFAVAERLPMAI